MNNFLGKLATIQNEIEIDQNREIPEEGEEGNNHEQNETPPKKTLKEALLFIKAMCAFSESRSEMTTEAFQAITH